MRPYVSSVIQPRINRAFQAAAQNEKWLADITEFQIPAGKVYRSPIIDCCDGLVMSWPTGEHPNAELVNTMLDAATETVADSSARPIVHSDRGAHYRWPGWLSRIGRFKRSLIHYGHDLDGRRWTSCNVSEAN